MPLGGIGNTHSQLIVHQATFDKAGSNLSQFNSSSEDLAISLLESFRKMPNGDNRALVLNTRTDLVRLQAHVTQHGESLKRVRQKHLDLIEKH